jgi:hypothetical protein
MKIISKPYPPNEELSEELVCESVNPKHKDHLMSGLMSRTVTLSKTFNLVDDSYVLRIGIPKSQTKLDI